MLTISDSQYTDKTKIFDQMNIKIYEITVNNMQIEITESISAESYKILPVQFYRGYDGIFVAFDLT